MELTVLNTGPGACVLVSWAVGKQSLGRCLEIGEEPQTGLNSSRRTQLLRREQFGAHQRTGLLCTGAPSRGHREGSMGVPLRETGFAAIQRSLSWRDFQWEGTREATVSHFSLQGRYLCGSCFQRAIYSFLLLLASDGSLSWPCRGRGEGVHPKTGQGLRGVSSGAVPSGAVELFRPLSSPYTCV